LTNVVFTLPSPQNIETLLCRWPMFRYTPSGRV